MSLPSNGPISLSDILSELRSKHGNITISLGDSRLRRLAGKTSGPISFSDFRGKVNKPSAPWSNESGFGRIHINSPSGSNVRFNGQIGSSSQSWTWSGTNIFDGYATCFWPSDDRFYESYDSDGFNVKILGRPSGIGSNGDEDAKIMNSNAVAVNSYQRSTVHNFNTTNWVNVGGEVRVKPHGNPVWVRQYGESWTFVGNQKDSFDNDENRAGRHLSYNTYSWFEAPGYIKSALIQHRYNHKDYGIEAVVHYDPGLKS